MTRIARTTTADRAARTTPPQDSPAEVDDETNPAFARTTRRKAAPIDPRLVTRAAATRRYLVGGIIVGTLTGVLVLCQAKLLAGSIASVFSSHTTAGLALATGLLAAVIAGRGVLAWANTWLAHRAAADVKTQLRRDIIAARLTAPTESSTSSSGLVTLVTQGLDGLDGYFGKYLPQLLLAATVPLILGVAILVADFRSALIIAATIPFIPTLMALVGWHTEKQVAKRWEFQSRLSAHFADLIAGLPTLQVFGRARAQIEGLRRTEAANRRETMAILRVSFLSAFVLELFSSIAVAVIALVIGTRLVYGQMDFETALFVLILAPEVYLPIRQVGVHYHDSADGLSAAEAAFAEIDAGYPAPAPGAPVPTSTAIAARGLSFTYPEGRAPALGPLDLTVEPGEIVALAGPSGGGKTTLLTCVLGFHRGDGLAGSLTVGGEPVTEVDLAAWRALTAYVPQTPGLIDGTIADNVRLGHPEASDDEVRRVLLEAGAGGLEPDRIVDAGGEGLSIGERRRVGIARALARIHFGGGRLLLLDEPTAGLDATAEATVLESLRASGAGGIIVSHRQAVLDAADRVVEILPPTGAAGGDLDESESGPQGAPDSSSADQESVGSNPREALIPGLEFTGSGADRQGAAPKADVLPVDTETLPRRHGGSPLTRLVLGLLDSVPSGRARLVAAVLCAAAASGAAVSLMGVSAWLISKAAQHPPFLELSVAAVGVRFFGIARAVFRYVERLVGHDIALRMQTALRLRSYAALARTTLVGRAKGDLLVRVVSDVSAIEDVVVRVIQPFCAAVLVVAGCGALIARFSPAAAGTLVLSAIAGGIIVPWLAQRLSSAADAAAAPLRGRLGQTVHDITLTAPDVAAYGAETRSLARVDALDDRLRHTDARAAWARGLGDGLQVIAAGAAILAGLVIGATAVADGAMGDRLLAVLVLIPLALHEVFANFSQAAQTLTRARVSLARVDAILEAEPIGRGDAILAPSGEPGTITCRNLTIGWPGGEAIADGLDLSLAPGRSVAITGPSGIGKTTWAATIMGLIPPLGGDLATSGRIGYLAQDAHIFATTVAENVRIGAKDATDEDVAAALAEAGLPLDPQRRIGEGGSTLSGGEARRLSLARLFAGDSALLILDEPTEHLDRETADRLADDIWSRLGERPVLVITHDERLAARCNEVVEMH